MNTRDAFDHARQQMLARWLDHARTCPDPFELLGDVETTLTAMRQILQLRLDEVPPRDIRDDIP